jgi:hypothetical protein
MKRSGKITALLQALLLASNLMASTPGAIRAEDASPSDPQTIINSLVQQLNQLQSAQSANSTDPPTNATNQPVAKPTQPSAQTAVVSQPQAAATTVAVPGGITLTMENIPAFVAPLGYEAKKVNDNCYSIDASRDGWTLYVNIWPDKYQKKVWFIAYMREIKDMSTVPTDALVKLLEANNQIGPSHFYLSKNCIYIGRALENENVTPVRFRHELDQFFADCQKTEQLWAVEKWPTNSNSQNTASQLSSNQTVPATPAP